MDVLTPNWTAYALLDTGGGKKLEQFGEFTLVRPEPQAKWQPKLPPDRWAAASAEFVKGSASRKPEWKIRRPLPPRWIMQRKNLKFWVQPAPSGHLGLFPDQACHWDWIEEKISRAPAPVRMLSLFGHTGLATLAAATAGAQVTHVDASRPAIAGPARINSCRASPTAPSDGSWKTR